MIKLLFIAIATGIISFVIGILLYEICDMLYVMFRKKIEKNYSKFEKSLFKRLLER